MSNLEINLFNQTIKLFEKLFFSIHEHTFVLLIFYLIVRTYYANFYENIIELKCFHFCGWSHFISANYVTLVSYRHVSRYVRIKKLYIYIYIYIYICI